MKQKKEKTRGKASLQEIANNEAVAGWKDRIEQEMKKQRLSQRKLAERATLGATTIRHVLKDADTISLETMRRISNALNVPVEYLTANVDRRADGDLEILNVERADGINSTGDTIAVMKDGLPDTLHALRVTDNSMMEYGSNMPLAPTTHLLKGDVVIYSPNAKCVPGELAVIEMAGSKAVRMLAVDDSGSYIAVPSNAAFQRLPVSEKNLIGRVLIVQRVLYDA